MPMLVAVIEAPAKIAGIASTLKMPIKPSVPKAKGSTTPTTATENAWAPTGDQLLEFALQTCQE